MFLENSQFYSHRWCLYASEKKIKNSYENTFWKIMLSVRRGRWPLTTIKVMGKSNAR